MKHLSDYAYYFYGYTDQTRVNASGIVETRLIESTGFFLRKDTDLFLVSCAHSFFNLNHRGQAVPTYKYPTKFFLKLKDKVTGKVVDFPVDVTNYSVPDDFFNHHPDLFWIKATIPGNYEINVINDYPFVNEATSYDIVQATMVGFPQSVAPESSTPLPVLLNPTTYYDNVNITEFESESQSKLKWISGRVATGNSGSPLFLQLDNGRWFFGGVCFAERNGDIYFIRPQYLIKGLDLRSSHLK